MKRSGSNIEANETGKSLLPSIRAALKGASVRSGLVRPGFDVVRMLCRVPRALIVLVVGAAGPTATAFADQPRPLMPALAHEVREPPTPANGTVLVIHGGAWELVGPEYLASIAPEAARVTGYGWRTVNVDYRAGRLALPDVRRWFDWARTAYSGPLCAFGESAGAQLALMLAATRSVDCVIGHGALTDLKRVHGNPLAADLRRAIARSFGRQLARHSPVEHPAPKRARVVLATSRSDPLAPCRHIRAYRAVRPTTSIHCLPTGGTGFIHANVAEGALATLHGRERKLLASIAP